MAGLFDSHTHLNNEWILEDIDDICKRIEENGLEYGFATFWNSQAITVLSDSRVRVANTDINENGIAPCYYQQTKNLMVFFFHL